jgi:chorismate synthase
MAGNSFGTLLKLSTFGESHGGAIGGILEGCPAGLKIDPAFIASEMARRRPGQSERTTQRQEDDQVEFLSGLLENVTTGAPIGFIIRNKDQRPADYSALSDKFRPSHADFTYSEKYGLRDHRGGGRSSARETACRVAGGAVAKLLLAESGTTVQAYVKQIGNISTAKDFQELDLKQTEKSMVRCPDAQVAAEMVKAINAAKEDGDSLGGVIQCVALGVPSGLGEPVFDKLHALLGHAMLSINAVKGFEIGSGFGSAGLRGSEMNDEFIIREGKTVTRSNNSGGVQGGISNGMPIYFNVAFKPVSTIAKTQRTVNTAGEEVDLAARGRHDPCVLPRAVAIVEAMTALVLADTMLLARSSRL